MPASVHEHVRDHVDVHELRPASGFSVDVDVHVDVIGFFIWMPLGCFVLS